MFLLPGVAESLKRLYKPLHVFWGVTVLLLAVASALMGLTEKSLFSNKELAPILPNIV